MKTRFRPTAAVLILAGFASGWISRPLTAWRAGDNAAASAAATPSAARKGAGAAGRSVPGTLPGTAITGHAGPAPDGMQAAAGRAVPFEPGGARKWMHELGGLDYLRSGAGRDALAETMAAFSARDFTELHQAALEEMEDASRPNSGRAFAARLLELAWPLWAGRDPDAALAGMARASLADPGLPDGGTVAKVFRRLASKDPQAAAEALGQGLVPENRLPDAAMGLVTAAAARDGPLAALEEAGRLGIPVDVSLFVDSAMARDPARAAALIAATDTGGPLGGAFRQAMEQWVKTDPAAAESWLGTCPEPGRTTGMTALLERRADTDPEGAAAAFLKLEGAGLTAGTGASASATAAEAGGPFTNVLAHQLGQALVSRSGPQAALEWMGQLPQELQDSAVSGLVERWSALDAESASRWLSGRPEGPARDAGVKALIGCISDTNPAEAWEWALSVSDPKSRGDALRDVFRQWQGKNDGAAMAALQALDPPLSGLRLR